MNLGPHVGEKVARRVENALREGEKRLLGLTKGGQEARNTEHISFAAKGQGRPSIGRSRIVSSFRPHGSIQRE